MAPITPLRDPGSFFRDQPDWAERFRTPLLLAAAAVALVTAAYYGVSLVVGELASGTVVVDNAAYPGDQLCDVPTSMAVPDGCSEPATVERPRSAVYAEMVWEVGSTLSVLTLFGFAGSAISIAGASFRFHGDGTIANSLVVAAWGTVPFALILSVNAPILGYVVLEGGGPAGVAEVFGQFAPLMGFAMIAASLWAAYLWYAGLQLLHEVTDRQATIAVLGLLPMAIAFSVGLYGP